MFGVLLPLSPQLPGHEVPETPEYGAWVHVQMRRSTITQVKSGPQPMPYLLRLRIQMQVVPCVHMASLQLIYEGEAQEPCYLYRGSHPSALHNLQAISAIALCTTNIGFFQHAGDTTWSTLKSREGYLAIGQLKLPFPIGAPFYHKPFKTQPENSHIVHNTHLQGGLLQINDLAPGVRLLHPYAALAHQGQSLLHSEQYYCTIGSMGAQSQLEMVKESELSETQTRIPFTLQDPPSDEEKMTLHEAVIGGHIRIRIEQPTPEGSSQTYTYTAIDASAPSPDTNLADITFQLTV